MQLPKISAKTPLAAAIRHALSPIKRLRPYIEHGFLEIDDNPAERAMRPIGLGKLIIIDRGQGTKTESTVAQPLIRGSCAP